jgi:26S proteasome regulatory subunit N3
LDYSEAGKHLTQALRKAPSSAIGFRQTVHKLSVTVQLLLGTIPERHLFLVKAHKASLAPYFELTKGELEIFFLSFVPYSNVAVI